MYEERAYCKQSKHTSLYVKINVYVRYKSRAMYMYVCACIQSSQHNETCVSQMKKKQSRRSKIQATILSKFSNNSIQSIQEELSNHLSISYSNRHSFIYNHILYIYM